MSREAHSIRQSPFTARAIGFVVVAAIALLTASILVINFTPDKRAGDIQQGVLQAGDDDAGGETNDAARNAFDASSNPCGGKVVETRAGFKRVSYGGVSFVYHKSLAAEMKARRKPASPLEGKTDKPDGVVPRHLSFSFSGQYATKHSSSFFEPEISVYSINEYKEALALSTEYVEVLERDVQSLKTILARRSTAQLKEIPVLPFGIDASQAFQTHVKYADFVNGKGIFFLTQFNIEPSLINNQGLTYIFQGLTGDGLHYVSARFPVSVPFLPPSYASTEGDGYKLPANFYDARALNEKNYAAYIGKTVARLQRLPPDKFEPHLTSFDELIKSLCVKTDD